MHIVINQSNNVFGMDAENKIFAQSTETITFDVTFNDPQAALQGLYCALLSDSGKTLALTTISENKAVLDTNTIECVEYVAQWAIGTTRHAFLVIGESTKPLAIIDVEVAQNPLEGIMPPTESAPSYPTSAELQEILTQITAQATVASKSAQSANQSAILINNAKDEIVRIGAQITTDKASIAGYASSASSSASRAEEAKRIAVNASESVSEMQDEIGATKTKIDATAKTVQSNATAVADAKTAVAMVQTAITEAVGKAETAKTDAVKAQGQASKSAEQASTSASNASKSAEQAESAKTAIGDVGGRLDSLETLDGVVEKRDIFGEIQKVLPAETNSFKHANVVVRNVATTKNGNVVVYAQHINTWNSLYVIGKDGTILAEQKSAHGMGAGSREWLVQSSDAVYFLTKTACYKITDTETSATIASIGNLDLNGLATNLPEKWGEVLPTRTLTIGDKVIIETLVIDLTLLKVVQVLTSGIVAPYIENGEFYATFANGNVAQLTVSADGLIGQADFVNGSGTLLHKKACVVGIQSATTACLLLPSKTAMALVYLAYKHKDTKYGEMSILPILPYTTVGRDKHTLAIATDGNIVRFHAVQKGSGYSLGVALGMVNVPLRRFPHIVGVDDGGLWAIEERTSVWAGSHPTSALVRVNF